MRPGGQRNVVRLFTFSFRLDMREQTPERAEGDAWTRPLGALL
jgi:hypothetical protein